MHLVSASSAVNIHCGVGGVLCCAVLRFPALCSACCAVLLWTFMRCALMGCAAHVCDSLRFTVLRRTALRCALLCFALSCAAQCCASL